MPRYADRARSDAWEAGKPGKAYRLKLSDKFRRATIDMSRSEQLHYAVHRNNMVDARVLLEAGAVPFDETQEKAVEKKKRDGVKLFVDYGIKPTQHALALARHNSDRETRDILLRSGIAPCESELEYAVWDNKAEWVDTYIKHGARPTPEMLDFAIRKSRDAQIALLLLDAGVVPDTKTLEFVVEKKRGYWIETLVTHGATPTPEMLNTALGNKDMESAQALIAEDVVPDEWALVLAIHHRNKAWLEMLLEAKAKPTNDMLYSAIYNYRLEAAELLIAHGVVPDKAVLKLADCKDYARFKPMLVEAVEKAKTAEQPAKKLILRKAPAAPVRRLVVKRSGL